MTDAAAIKKNNLEFIELSREYTKTVAFILKDNANKDSWKI